MKRTLHAREGPPWWLVKLSQYRYQIMAIIILMVLVGSLAWGHNPAELEGVYQLG